MHKIVFLLASAGWASAQTPNASLTFDVASVRISGQVAPNTNSTVGVLRKGEPTRNPVHFSRHGMTLERLLLNAYSIALLQLLIGPEWLGSTAYDIDALAPQGSTNEQQLVMLQNLLKDRFAMRIHRETREMSVYELVVAKGGPKMARSGPNSPLPPMQRRALPGSGRRTGDGSPSMAHFEERGTMDQLAARLAPYLGRPIVNHTGLVGEYDVALKWAPGALTPPPVTGEAPNPGISIFMAIQSQLGLKADATRSGVEVLVIDHVEKVPTEN